MTRPPKFEIDLSKQFPKLPNAPIVEAVIQFNAQPTRPIEREALKTHLEQRFEGYRFSHQVQMEAGITGSSGGMELHQKSVWDGLRGTSLDGKYVCQWKRNCLVFSRLAPYEDWNAFYSAAIPFWLAYCELLAPELIETIGVRFISQIALQPNGKVSDFVRSVPPPLKGLGLRSDSFFYQDTIPIKGYPYEVRLNRGMQRSATPAGHQSILIVDIDVTKTEATSFPELDRTLQEMRFLKNEVFFAFMKHAESKFS